MYKVCVTRVCVCIYVCSVPFEELKYEVHEPGLKKPY